MNSTLVWVTGAHGFIGRHVARAFADAGRTVAGIGHGAWPASETQKSGVSYWLNGDVASSNLGTLRSLSGAPDVVVHLAGGSSVGSAIAQPREDFNRTVTSTVELFEWLRQESPETKVIAVSTAAVYGADNEGMIGENAALKPYSPYGFHKVMMESVCDSYGANYGIRSVVARLFSVYGAGLKKQLLWDLCTMLFRNADLVKLGGTGNELRDWVAVSDAANILSRMAFLASAEVPKFNVGTGIGTQVRDVAECLVNAWHGKSDSGTRILFSGESRLGDPFSLVASPEKIAALGFECGVAIPQGISRYVAWFRHSHA